MLLNFGGPGGAGVSELAAGGKEFMSLTNGYDVVSFDPRGVGRSSPVTCGDGTDAAAATGRGAGRRRRSAGRARQLRKGGRRVRQALRPVLPHIGTVNASRDLDVMRQALGDKKLNYLGFSYGTRLGAVYAAQFPKKVGRMVLDGVDTLTEPLAEQGVAGAAGQQTALEDFVDWCVKDIACPFGTDARAAREQVVRLVDSLDEDPVPTDFGEDFAGQDLVGAIGQALYSKELWPSWSGRSPRWTGDRRPDTRAAAPLVRRASGSVLRRGRARRPGSDGGSGGREDVPLDNLPAALMAINCADDPDRPGAGRITKDNWAGCAPQYEQASPVFGRYRLTEFLMCYGRPRGTDFIRDDVRDVRTPKMLLVGTRGDPATPYRWTVETAERLGDSAVVLDNKGEGHTGYGSSKCVHRKVDDFLLYGSLPPDGSSCGAERRLTRPASLALTLPVCEPVHGRGRPGEAVVAQYRPQFGVEAVDLRLGGPQGFGPRVGQLQHHGPVFVRMCVLGDEAGRGQPPDQSRHGDSRSPSVRASRCWVVPGSSRTANRAPSWAVVTPAAARQRRSAVVRRRCAARLLEQEVEALVLGLGHGPMLTDGTGPRQSHFTSEMRCGMTRTLDLELARKVLAAQPFSTLVGARLTAFEEGAATLEFDIRGELLQQHGAVHGGVLGYAADNALSFAAGSAAGFRGGHRRFLPRLPAPGPRRSAAGPRPGRTGRPHPRGVPLRPEHRGRGRRRDPVRGGPGLHRRTRTPAGVRPRRQKSTGSPTIGQVMQWPPPRPRPSSAPTTVMTSIPSLRSSVLVVGVAVIGEDHAGLQRRRRRCRCPIAGVRAGVHVAAGLHDAHLPASRAPRATTSTKGCVALVDEFDTATRCRRAGRRCGWRR